MQKYLTILLLAVLLGCKSDKEPVQPVFDEEALLLEQQSHPNERMRFKVWSSRVEREDIFKPFHKALKGFTEEDYKELEPVILNKTIPELQQAVNARQLSYTDLVLFYLYRIQKYESNPATSLHAVIALNPNVLEEAAARDREHRQGGHHPIFGMPVLLKDNIGTDGMPTTAGAIALENNMAEDAFIVKRLKANGALILGKVNLSEWAYYFCDGCPVGYSAIGGQTLNPYGPGKYETGGSSSGSGVAVAAQYAVAAVGTETSGSILSPSSANSLVGLKPTVGLLSRTGIVPISSTLDTPGPMTRNVTDNAILLSAMTGADLNDVASVNAGQSYADSLANSSLLGKRLGVFRELMEKDTLYAATVRELEKAGAWVVAFDPPDSVSLKGFLTLLNLDMRYDLPAYLEKQASKNISLGNVQEIVEFNKQDSLLRMPYGQQLFLGILNDTTQVDAFEIIKRNLNAHGKLFFDEVMEKEQLDAVLSVNNRHAAYAAVARYPALTVPMGYRTDGEPAGLTLIGRPFQELELLRLALAFENLGQKRVNPKLYP